MSSGRASARPPCGIRVGLPGPEQVHYTTAISPERVRHEGIQADDQSGATSLPSASRIISPYDQYKARSAYEQQRAGERGDVNPPQRLDMGDFAGETPREPSIWAQAGQALSGASAGAADLLNRAGAGIDKALFPPDTNPFSPNKLLPGGVWGGMAAAGAMGRDDAADWRAEPD